MPKPDPREAAPRNPAFLGPQRSRKGPRKTPQAKPPITKEKVYEMSAIDQSIDDGTT